MPAIYAMPDAFDAAFTLQREGVALDVSAATVTVYARSAATMGTPVAATTAFEDDGTDGRVTATWAAGTFASVGRWRLYALVDFVGDDRSFYTESVVLDVREPGT